MHSGLHSVEHSTKLEAQAYRSRLEAAYATDEKPAWLREEFERRTSSARYSVAAVRAAEVRAEVGRVVAAMLRRVEAEYG